MEERERERERRRGMEGVTGSYREEGFKGLEKERGIELGLGGGVAFERLREGVNKGYGENMRERG